MSNVFEVRSAKGTAADAPAIVLKFWKAGDRYWHSVAVENEAGFDWQLLSMEGDDTQDSPDSPPVQDLSIEKRSTSTVALGVGMAGETIWSISFEAIAGAGRILCDIACNPRGNMPGPRSTYHLQNGNGNALESQMEVIEASVDSSSVESGRRLGPLMILPATGPDLATKLVMAGSTLSLLRENSPKAREIRQNLRWGYEFKLA